jgi:hypothetical protein
MVGIICYSKGNFSCWDFSLSICMVWCGEVRLILLIWRLLTGKDLLNKVADKEK